MKKMFLVIGLCVTALSAWAQSVPAGLEWKAAIIGDGITITRYSGSSSILLVPSRIDGKPVTSISNSAFGKNEKLSSVLLPASLTSISASQFAGCTKLSRVTLSRNTRISGAFPQSVQLSYIEDTSLSEKQKELEDMLEKMKEQGNKRELAFSAPAATAPSPAPNPPVPATNPPAASAPKQTAPSVTAVPAPAPAATKAGYRAYPTDQYQRGMSGFMYALKPDWDAATANWDRGAAIKCWQSIENSSQMQAFINGTPGILEKILAGDFSGVRAEAAKRGIKF